jgi:hypothetical protein
VSAAVDIGHGVTIKIHRLDGVPAGLSYEHPHPTLPAPYVCSGYVPFAGRPADTGNGWTVEADEPLTISPSLLCRACGHHGFIRGGKWVPA